MGLARLPLVFLALAGCAPAEPPAQAPRPIVSGVISGVDDAVVALLDRGTVLCTGVLVAPRVVVTAAHCLDTALAPAPMTLTVAFGPDSGEPDATRAVVASALHPAWDRGSFANDVGVIALHLPAPVPPVPMNLANLEDAAVGRSIRLVGYGTTRAGAVRSAGIKRVAETRISAISARTFTNGNEPGQTCGGDSGAPVFYDRGGGELVIGVASFGDADCAVFGVNARLDPYESFLVDFLDQFATPGTCGDADGVCLACAGGDPDCLDRCLTDGVCQATGCAVPDEDCLVSCGAGNQCVPGCEPPDPDCEPGFIFVGGPCVEGTDCLTGLCVASLDDERSLICSRGCDDDDDCPRPAGRDMRCFAGVCLYDGPSPASPGWPCTAGAQCRSGICLPEQLGSICSVRCDGDECPFRFQCHDIDEARLCLPDGGCGLGVAAPGRPAAMTPLLLGLLILALLRRRAL